jgi:molecular chaperone GrpE
MFGKNKKTIKMEDETLNDASGNEVNATPEEIKQKEEKVKHEKKRPKSKDDVILDFHQQVKDLNDKYLRLYAEFDNYRKRTMKERIDMTKSAASDMISDLLTVVDDFDRANKSFENTSDVEALKEGVQLIYSKFKNILTQKGLEEMKSVGEVFNTDLHEAIANVPAESEDMKDKIIDEVQKGYLLNGKVLRYAKVVVAN